MASSSRGGRMVWKGLAVLGAAAGVLLWGGCSSSTVSNADGSSGSSSGKVCSVGSIQPCFGQGNCTGTQACKTDSSGWEACVCGGTSGGGGGAQSAAAGSGPGGTAGSGSTGTVGQGGGNPLGRSNAEACGANGDCASGFCLGKPGQCCSQDCGNACFVTGQCNAGDCVPVAGAQTCGQDAAFCALAVNDPTNAALWSMQSNLRVGDQVLGSDTYTFTAVSPTVAGSFWLRPSRASKLATANPLVTFTISAPADIFVALDTRLAPPAWLSDWTDTGGTLGYTSAASPVTEKLYKKRFPAGQVALGPLACASEAVSCAMYIVVIRFADQPADAAGPACAR